MRGKTQDRSSSEVTVSLSLAYFLPASPSPFLGLQGEKPLGALKNSRRPQSKNEFFPLLGSLLRILNLTLNNCITFRLLFFRSQFYPLWTREKTVPKAVVRTKWNNIYSVWAKRCPWYVPKKLWQCELLGWLTGFSRLHFANLLNGPIKKLLAQDNVLHSDFLIQKINMPGQFSLIVWTGIY